MGVPQVSIHAPRAGSDVSLTKYATSFESFNPRSPRGERPWSWSLVRSPGEFQSTLPARGATGADGLTMGVPRVSIHAPRAGSDVVCLGAVGPSLEFQSTLPARGATKYALCFGESKHVSIHAPRAGSDELACHAHALHKIVSIHAPRAGSDRESN